MVKKLENGPSKAELARRNLIEIDQDELEERVERLNRVTLKVITKSLGLSKLEQHQKVRNIFFGSSFTYVTAFNYANF